MDEYSDKFVNSALAAHVLHQKKNEEKSRKTAIVEKSFQLSSEQIALLKESTELANKAYNETQDVRAESKKASKRAYWSNIIAIGSLIVAIATLVYSFFSNL